MAEPITRDRVVDAVRQLPEDATLEEAMERLYFLAKVERGVREADEGKTISHEEVRETPPTTPAWSLNALFCTSREFLISREPGEWYRN